MTLLTKKEFAEKCGRPTNWLSTYIKRGKIAMLGDKIDEDHPVNIEFVEKWGEKSGQTAPVYSENEKELSETTHRNTSVANNRKSLNEVEREHKEALLEKTKVETRIKLLDEQKKMGENIPTDSVKVIISQLTKSLITNFHVASENFLIEIAKQKDLNNEELALFRGKLVNGINSSSDRAIEQAKAQIKALVREISIKREVGEHD